MAELLERTTDKLLLSDLIDNDFESIVKMLRANIYKAEPIVSPCTIQLSLNTGYAFAKRIYLKLRDDGYLDEKNRLIYRPYHLPLQNQSRIEQENQDLFLSKSSALPLNKDLLDKCLYQKANTAPDETIYPLFTEIPSLDRIIKGFDEGSLNLLAASQETDTTRFSLDLATRIAEYNFIQLPVLYVSLDKSLDDIALLFCSTAGKISPEDYSKKRISAQQYRDIHRHLGLLRLPDGRPGLFLDEGYRLTVMQLKEKIISAMDTCHGLSCIIIDAIHLLENENSDSSFPALSEIIEEFSHFASMLNIPVIATLSRTGQVRDDTEITSFEAFCRKTGIEKTQQKIGCVLLLKTAPCSADKKNRRRHTIIVLKNNRYKKICL